MARVGVVGKAAWLRHTGAMSSIRNIVILTGAGISAESGIRTFRASDGLWEDHRIEDVATPEGFAANPDLVQRFYDARRAGLWRRSPMRRIWLWQGWNASGRAVFCSSPRMSTICMSGPAARR
jgi:NAD-dependent deacetylase